MAETHSDLDALMSEDPLNLSDADIDLIILAQRNSRAQRAEGIKPKRGSTGPKQKIDLRALGLIKDTPKPTITPSGSGLRRI